VKIKINKSGWLLINRAGKWKAQDCRQGHADASFAFPPCCDDCPLFGEPFEISPKMVGLSLCKTTLYCDLHDFEDERDNVGEDGGDE
jgi:hypothetical protein